MHMTNQQHVSLWELHSTPALPLSDLCIIPHPERGRSSQRQEVNGGHMTEPALIKQLAIASPLVSASCGSLDDEEDC
jgi:hypothetical protein